MDPSTASFAAAGPGSVIGFEAFVAALASDATNLSVLATDPAQSSPLVIVDLREWEDSSAHSVQIAAGQLPACPVIGVAAGGADQALPNFVDAVVERDADLASIQKIVAKCPHAATVFVQLLRHNEGLSVAQGLFAESLAYSTLQHGAEFSAWLTQRQNTSNESSVAKEDPAEPAVRVSREFDRLHITLNRPQRKNAFSTEMRDLLCEALELALADGSIKEIQLSAAGTAFCAGGDLQEFGEARDAAVAHLSRTTRSAGALLHRLSSRVSVRVQGACIGAGIELPAFAGQIRAHPDSFFVLPEVGLGLVPGAGGCSSLLRRIGRQRTAFMGLSGARIDAQQALTWGLIDDIAAS